MNIVYTVIATTIAIILAEIFGNYGLGDLVKDFFVGVFGKVKSFSEARIQRLEAKLAVLKGKL